MDIQKTKPFYLPPKVVAVAFKVELGNMASNPVELDVLPFENGFSASKSYNRTYSSGDDFFGGGNTSSAPGTTDYGNYDWGW